METKLNGYVLREELKKKMRDVLYKTQQEELGFTLCSKPDNVIVPRGFHVGSSHEIEINPRSCEKDEKYLGGYHTHPGTDSQASARVTHNDCSPDKNVNVIIGNNDNGES